MEMWRAQVPEFYGSIWVDLEANGMIGRVHVGAPQEGDCTPERSAKVVFRHHADHDSEQQPVPDGEEDRPDHEEGQRELPSPAASHLADSRTKYSPDFVAGSIHGDDQPAKL